MNEDMLALLARASGIRGGDVGDDSADLRGVPLREHSVMSLTRVMSMSVITASAKISRQRAVNTSGYPWLLDVDILRTRIAGFEPVHAAIKVSVLEVEFTE